MLTTKNHSSANGWLEGAALGAAVAYLFDSVSGRRRRHMARDKVIHLTHRTASGARKAGVDLVHRAEGLAAIARAKTNDEGAVADEILVERVRSKLGRFVSHPHAIQVTANGGEVTLTGPILTREARRLVRAIGNVPGCHGVVDRLERHKTAEDIPALQGGVMRRPRAEVLQEVWSPAIRLLAGAAGVMLATLGLRARGPFGLATGLFGSGVLVRALTNLPARRLFGVGAGCRAVEIDKAIFIAAPVEEVFSFFQSFENFPRFMSHLERVDVDGETSRWVARGPAGLHVSWHAEVTRFEPNRLMAWRSRPGSIVSTAGIVRFEPDARGGTLLSVHMSYNPPAGALGHVVASIFGADAKHAMDDDLLRLKSLLEHGSATAHHHKVWREDLVKSSS